MPRTHQLLPESQEVTEGLPVSSHTYTILLERDEKDTIRAYAPRTFLERARRGAYTYVFFFARAPPLLAHGLWGDLWLRITPGAEGIYYKDRDERWVPLRRGALRTEVTRQPIYHPWLGKRTLQFDGTKLGWFRSNEWLRSRTSWDEWLRFQVAVPSLPDGRVEWVARYLAQRMSSVTTGKPGEAVARVTLPQTSGSSRPVAPASGTIVASPRSEANKLAAPSSSNKDASLSPDSEPRTTTSYPSTEPMATSSSSSCTSGTVSSSLESGATPSSSDFQTTSAPSQPDAVSPSSGIESSSSSSSSKPHTKPSKLSSSNDKATSSLKENAPRSHTKRTPPTGPRRLVRTGLMVALLSSHIRAVPLQDSTNIRPVRNVAPRPGSTKELDSTFLTKSAPRAQVVAKPPAIIVKQEENHPPLLGIKRPRVADSAVSADDAPSKRIKTEEDEDSARQFLRPATDGQEKVAKQENQDILPDTVDAHDHAKLVLVPTGQPSLETRRDSAVGKFLASLPVPLDHHAALFLSLGIADMSYIKAIASMPVHILNELVFALEDHGLNFVEALVLRDALDALPTQKNCLLRRADFAERPWDSVDVFLNSLRPSMIHHAPAFRGVGLHVNAHVAALVVMEAHHYAAFETKLRRKGLSWMDCFIFRVAVQGY
ncbi:hypothetical protein L227DRAFT_613950 [Lentinus tigrinus ALCF2SS1-6]|uniref:Uncharacterized protein n=1 Tax=Lentinus tigrinus ALCF2SS1-6 TaxID=1328759 RepID=A0A5C2S108_9APHY|nr:hypothetical protein L227DRAFT_613950 [Lentinus tigrinus ALCF2SS1-6]